MVTPCPLCHTVLDGFQKEMKVETQKLEVPILHFHNSLALRWDCRQAN